MPTPNTHKTVHVHRRQGVAERTLLAMREVPASTAPLLIAAAMLGYMINLREAHFGSWLQFGSGWVCVGLLFTIGRFPTTRTNAWRLVFVLLSGYLALPANGGHHPAILLIHE